jgi:hypothetical protein
MKRIRITGRNLGKFLPAFFITSARWVPVLWVAET